MLKRTERGVLCNVLIYGACRPASARAIPSDSEGTLAGPCAITLVGTVHCLFVIVHLMVSAFPRLTCQRRHDQIDSAPHQLCMQDHCGTAQTSMRIARSDMPAFGLSSGKFSLCLQDTSSHRQERGRLLPLFQIPLVPEGIWMVTLVHHYHFVHRHARRRLDLLRPCCRLFLGIGTRSTGGRRNWGGDVNQDRLCYSSMRPSRAGSWNTSEAPKNYLRQ